METSSVETLVEAFQQRLLRGQNYTRINEARTEASHILGQPIRSGDPITKVIDEAMEKAVVRTAHRLLETCNTSHQAYDRMVDLMVRQPNLSVRTSTSVLQQAYSTPVPIAYLASVLAGITSETSVYEPTAGNGALLIGADPTKVIANELNDSRYSELAKRGYAQLTQHDATTYSPGQHVVDVVITNPPFGSVKGENGKRKHFPIGDTWSAQVDHAIALTALASMKDEGKAVLILGGKRGGEEEQRSERYNSRESRGFFYTLYGQYNVRDHFSLDGDLYRKQGAGFPIDVVVIEGRGKSARPLPAAAVPQIYDSFSALKEKLPNVIRASQVPRLPEPMGNGVSFTSIYGQSPSGLIDGRSDLPGADESESRGANPKLDTRTAGESEGDAVSDAQPYARKFYRSAEDDRSAGGEAPALDGRVDGRVGRNSGALESEHSKHDERSARREPISEHSVDINPPRLSGTLGSLQRSEPGSLADRNSSPLNFSDSTLPNTVEEHLMAIQPSDINDLPEGKNEQEPAKQAPYNPKSSGRQIGSLIPQNQVSAAQTALSRLEQRQGNVDEFVRSRLNYDTVEELQGRLFAEQIDSVALAIDNLEQGKGFIVGDMTGQGKGCQCASILRYAAQQGKIPIFVTQKKELYADIMRDLQQIGMNNFNPFLTDTKADISLGDGLSLRSGSAADQQADMRQMMKDGNTSYYDGIFTTYSQLQTVSGKEPLRRDFFRALIDNSILVLDESHEAGGTKNERASKNAAPDRAEFVRELIDGSAGVVYSSATYAKRPDVMDLYARTTDLKSAIENGSSLETILERGGVPMQQIVSSGIVASGQMLRRERSFEGISFKAETTPVDREVADAFSGAMRSIMEFDRAKKKAVNQLKKELKAEAKAFAVDNAIGQTAVKSTNFTSLMHNAIEQGLLQQKAEAVVQKALQSLQSGKKPVIALDNTMGSFIEMYAESNDIKSGEPINITPADSLDRFLERSRDVTTTNYMGVRDRRPLTEDELGLEGSMAYDSAREQIEEFRELLAAHRNNMPMSPIDYIRHRLEQEGYRTAEVTGRTAAVQYGEDGATTYRIRPATEKNAKGKIAAVSQFNSGQIDVIILNRSGSTGISLHASEQFADRRPREMIVAQASKDINVTMQMFGRVNRVGQVEVPSYTLLMSDLPAEKRPGAILSRKMAGLNANVTASRETDISIKNVVDFMNVYGEEVVTELLNEMPELNHKLDDPLSKISSDSEIELLCRVTGRIPLLPIEEQEEVYQLLESEYIDFVAQKEAMGENLLEAGQLDLDARTIARMEAIPDRSPVKTEFTGPVYLEVVDAKADRKPLTQLEVINVLRQTLNLDPIKDIQQHDRTAIEELTTQQADKTILETKDATQKHLESLIHPSRNLKLEQKVKIKDKLQSQLKSVSETLREFPIGSSVRVDTGKQVLYGVVGNIEHKHRSGSPVTPSTWKVHLMLADGNRQMKIPLSQFNTGKKGTPIVMRQEKDLWTNTDIYEKFDVLQRAGRQQRQIFTGNLIKAVQKYPTGKLTNFTDNRGNVRQGLLMPREFDIDAALKSQPVPFKEPSQITEFFELTEGRSALRTMNELLRVSPAINNGIRLQAPKAKQSGARYYLDEKLLEIIGRDFVSKGEHMEVKVPADKVDDVLNHIMTTRAETLAVFDPKYQQQARDYLNIKLPTLETIESGEYVDQPDYVAPIAEVTGADRARLERLLGTSPETSTAAELPVPPASAEALEPFTSAAPTPATPSESLESSIPAEDVPAAEDVSAQSNSDRLHSAPSLSLESSLNESTEEGVIGSAVVLPGRQQKGPIEKRIATFLDKAGIREDLTAGEDFHLKIENEPYMPLVVERHNDELYLTHYFEQNGDLCLASEIVFKIDDGHLRLSQTATQNPLTGGESRRYDKHADRLFAQVFSRNIRNQGFGEAAREQLQQSQRAEAPAEEIQASETIELEDTSASKSTPSLSEVTEKEVTESKMSLLLSNGLEKLAEADRKELRQITEDYISARNADLESPLSRCTHQATVKRFCESAPDYLKPIVPEAMLYAIKGGDLNRIAVVESIGLDSARADELADELAMGKALLKIAAKTYAFMETQGKVLPNDALETWTAKGNHYDITYNPANGNFFIEGKNGNKMAVQSIDGEIDPDSTRAVSEVDIERFLAIEQALSQRTFERKQSPAQTQAKARVKWESAIVAAASVLPTAEPVVLPAADPISSPVVNAEQSLFPVEQYESSYLGRAESNTIIDSSWGQPQGDAASAPPEVVQSAISTKNTALLTALQQWQQQAQDLERPPAYVSRIQALVTAVESGNEEAVTARATTVMARDSQAWQQQVVTIGKQAQTILKTIGEHRATGTRFEGKSYTLDLSAEGCLSVQAKNRGEILRLSGNEIQHSSVTAIDAGRFTSFVQKVAQQVSQPVRRPVTQGIDR